MGDYEHKKFLYREKQYSFQTQLIQKYKKTLLLMKANYPSNNSIVLNIVKSMDNILTDIFNNEIYLKIFRITLEGPMVIILLDMNEMKAKKTCIEIEDKHMLGNCIDINVFSSKGISIPRKDLGYKKRKCIICDCVHDSYIQDEIHIDNKMIDKMREVYLDYINKYNSNIFR